MEKIRIEVDKVILYYMDRVDPDGNLYRFYVYCGLWASESKIEEMIADYKGRIYEYYEFKEEIINKIRQLYT